MIKFERYVFEFKIEIEGHCIVWLHNYYRTGHGHFVFVPDVYI